MCRANQKYWIWSWLLGLWACAAMANSELTLRPGDRVLLSLPGETSLNEIVEVRRDGSLLIPEIGDMKVAGLTLAEAEKNIGNELANLIHDISRFELLLKERLLMVNVLGYVNQPGQVLLEEGASVQEAISAAGGLTPGAQLDKIQLRRGETVKSFNYKQYLDSGELALLPPLAPLDTVFVPASPLIGNVQIEFDARTLSASGDAGDSDKAITVFGEVINPGNFSFKAGNSVVDLLMRAGGVTRYAGVEKIRLVRAGEPVMFDLKQYLDSGDRSLLPSVSPGDTIFVPTKADEVKSGLTVVYVMGEVFKPGAFEASADVSFLDILANAGGPTRFAETRQIRIIRQDGSVTPFDLQGYTEGTMQVSLPSITPGDAIFVPEKTDMNEKSWLKVPPHRAVKIIGEVKQPGRYEWSDEMSLFDLIAHAGGPNHKGNIARLKILSMTPGGIVTSRIFDMQNFIDNGGMLTDIPTLKAEDVVVVPELPQDPSDNKAQWVRQSSADSIYIMGEVVSPGRYMFNESMNFLDILAAAEGPGDNADLQHIRISHRNQTGAQVTKLDLGLYFESGDENLLPKVKNGDVIFVPARDRLWLGRSKEQTVRVLGAINRQGRYSYDSTMTILDLLAQAGGLNNNAHAGKIVVVNNGCCDNTVNTFDLLAYAESGDPGLLPPLRTGDTVYIMNKQDSRWHRFLSGVQDTLSVLSVFRILGGG